MSTIVLGVQIGTKSVIGVGLSVTVILGSDAAGVDVRLVVCTLDEVALTVDSWEQRLELPFQTVVSLR